MDRIDWTPFFITWELAGKYPRIFDDKVIGEEAKKLFADAQAMLEKIISEKWLQANAVIGFWPAKQTHCDDIEVTDEQHQKTWLLNHLRQQTKKTGEQANLCLADFVAPEDSGKQDYIGGFVVTAGIGLDDKVKEFEAAHDDYNAILLKSLADRLAEAFAERMHELVRK